MSSAEELVQSLVLKAMDSFPGPVLSKSALAEHIAKEMSDFKGLGGSMYVMRWAERAPDGTVSETAESVRDYPDWLIEEYARQGRL